MKSPSEVIVALSETLEMRDHCPECGGSGFNYVDIDGEAEADACSCSWLVVEVLEQYKEEISQAVDEYLKEKGYSREGQDDLKAFLNELLSEDRELK